MKRILICLLGIGLLASCGPNREKQLKAIAEHEQQLSMLEMSTEDTEFHEMIDLYRTFAHDFPNDSLAPVYMMRAADASISVGLPEQAVQLLDSVITLYPGFEDVGGCWFLKGYAYETAEQFEQAREAYTYFVDNYPEHYLAPDTRKTLPYIGMTAEEMFEAIMNNAAQEQ
ncbi:MAG: tetratricopeptide repeat protein [Bacteroidales bacterium]|nr:tetratricopeptide repeat protein [Bacteroidales bacterium]